ncbi:MAG: hypothetical protein Q9160_001730 [Pyrenula sp. 1 TL-2023]
MAAIDSPAVLVARFLRANNYDETLDAFLREAGLPQSAGVTGPNDLTIEKVLDEKRRFDASVRFERKGDEGQGKRGWTLPAPSLPKTITDDQTFAPSNVLCVSMLNHASCSNGSNSQEPSSHLLVTCADQKIYAFEPSWPDFKLKDSLQFHSSPVLSLSNYMGHLVSTDMAGEIVLSTAGRDVQRQKNHAKYVVKSATYQTILAEGTTAQFLATAGWDRKVQIYCQRTEQRLSELAPFTTITLESNPESLLFTTHPESNKLILIVSRHESTHLYFYAIFPPPETPSSETSQPPSSTLLGMQNLAPHSNAWVSFTPSSLALHPSDPTLIAIATSHIPHMKLIIARLLFPTSSSQDGPQSAAASQDAATTARLSLARENREDAALLVHVSTLAPQTPYSTPHVVWRPDASGVWVNGDDGCVRGLDAGSGKVMSVLRGGHEAGAKVRTICAGMVRSEDGEEREVVVSGGFDRRAVVWSVGDG